MCYSLLAALFSKTFLSHPPFKYPRSAPGFIRYISQEAHCEGFHPITMLDGESIF